MKIEIILNGESKQVNFTKPQANIMERLLKGEKTTMINTHYRSGGDFVWFDKDGNYFGAECVGWKAFNGAMYAIVKAFNLNNEQKKELYDKYFVES